MPGRGHLGRVACPLNRDDRRATAALGDGCPTRSNLTARSVEEQLVGRSPEYRRGNPTENPVGKTEVVLQLAGPAGGRQKHSVVVSKTRRLHLAITRALKSFQVEKTGGWVGFFKMRCGKRGVVSLFVRSAALYCATCRGAAAQRKSPQAFSTVGFLAAIPKIHGGGDEKRREDWAPLVASQVAASSRAWTSSPSSQPP